MLDKTFTPQDAEPRLYEKWEATGCFQPTDNPDAEPFTIVIPPPNVTGSLHIGHALNNTLQDVLIRYHRMQGKAALWLPGTDHAGIATQMVVERELAKEGQNRRDMGRDAFMDRVWQWKAQSGGTITKQLRRLGASCDWSRERFTLDDGLSAAVKKAFVKLYNDGLIYRAKRLVNWDPHFQTAISDLEVENKEVNGHFWHFKYPLENGETYKFPIARDDDGKPTEWEERDYIAIATTRPETMLGDGAVAVHPDDDRYKGLVGKNVLLPLVNRLIPIIADEHPDPEFGSGAVKITGAHDFNDHMVAKRHDLPMIELMDVTGAMLDADHIPAAYRGLDRFAARKAVVADLDELGLLVQVEDKNIMQPFGDRSGVVIEPMLTDQWFVDAETLAKPALKAVEDGDTFFAPGNWKNTYFEWLRNIEPWCISRQLWWGHRIPAWFGPDGEIFVAEDQAAAQAKADKHYGKTVDLHQDEDVLDTWFSSALWPFSTMGWPDENAPDFKRFYPTSTLVTAFDIIFFWVARMMMMGLYFTDQVPFNRVIINPIVRDAKGQKMSKSKGNVIDPLELVDEYGADALRLTLTAMSGQARNINLSKQRIEGYRNFGTKLWNAARFSQMNECVRVDGFEPATVQTPLNQWIVGAVVKAQNATTDALEAGRFDEAANTLYRFVWNTFCDWYVELSKPILNTGDPDAQAETRATTAWVLDEILKLLHPIQPYLTEELWDKLTEFGPARDQMLATTPWPSWSDDLINTTADAEIEWVIGLISEIRSVRAEMNVPPSAKPSLVLMQADETSKSLLGRHHDVIMWLGRLSSLAAADKPPEGAALFPHAEATAALGIAEFIDIEAERKRLQKDADTLKAEIKKTEGKLANENFTSRAPAEVVEEHKQRLKDHSQDLAKVESAIKRLPVPV